MEIFVPREALAEEGRAPMIPETVAKLAKKGAEIVVEAGIGAAIGVDDAAYEEAGARVSTERDGALGSADLVLRLRKPPLDEIAKLKKGCIHVSFLDPFNECELVDELVKHGISAISMEMIPRTTTAQKMDALSSQANLAGYVAAIVVAGRLGLALPMMMTPAGTLKPARVFVIGVGVAGLQAIATAKRLGARVEAFDTRPVVEEQVKSLGARFVKIDLGETGQTKDGYAKELTEEQREKQREAMAKVCAQSDGVITTAKLFGRKAPVIVTDDMIRSMKPGSVIVDLAADTGGNVEGTKPGEEIVIHGVKVVGWTDLEGRVPIHASQMYSSNLGSLVDEFWDEENKVFRLDLEHEIIQGCLITHGGEIVNQMIKDLRALSTPECACEKNVNAERFRICGKENEDVFLGQKGEN